MMADIFDEIELSSEQMSREDLDDLYEKALKDYLSTSIDEEHRTDLFVEDLGGQNQGT